MTHNFQNKFEFHIIRFVTQQINTINGKITTSY